MINKNVYETALFPLTFTLKPVFLKGVLKRIRAKTTGMTPSEKMCSLVLDEMAIKPHLDYNKGRDAIDGLTADGSLASQAMVFLARGITGKWKQVE